MSLLFVIVGIVIAFGLALLRALAVDEVRGRLQKRAEASVESTISSLPAELQEEWGDEWRAELAAMRAMPLSALTFARGLRRTALQLAGASELAPALTKNGNSGRRPAMARITRVASWLSERSSLLSEKIPPWIERLILACIATGMSLLVTLQSFFSVIRLAGPLLAVAGLFFALAALLHARRFR